ncbi:cation:proton antiporter, partial [Streptomyces sp. NPDC059949]
AGIEPAIGPLATAYVLILVVIGPLTARYTEPLAAWVRARRTLRPPLLAAVPSPAKSPESAAGRASEPAPDQDPAGRT